MLVVVAAVGAEHVVEVAAAEDEDAVEAFAADGAHPPLRERVRVGRLNRCPTDCDALHVEHLIEGANELCVAIVDEEPERLRIGELPRPQERTPGGARTRGRRLQSLFEEDLPHRSCRHRDAGAFEFARDAAVARVRILAGEPEDHCPHRQVERRLPNPRELALDFLDAYSS
jgi:hypothetical protein